MLKVVIITIVLLAIAFIAIGIKMFVKKGGEFKESCSSIDPDTGQRIGCTCGKAESGAVCENK